MAKNVYKITIHISRCNSVKGVYKDIPYLNCTNGQGDTITFKKQKVVIEAERSKKITPQEILYNNKNGLYRQIIKSILFLFLKNEHIVNLRSIDIDRTTKRSCDSTYSIKIDKYNQPIKGDFVLRYPIPDIVLQDIWRDDEKGKTLRQFFSYWLSALSSDNRLYIFENLWRAFERLAFYINRASGSKSEFDAIRAVKEYIWNHLDNCKDSLAEAKKVRGLQFRKFDWKGYIENEFPPLSTSAKTAPYTSKYKDYLVLCNQDFRIMEMLKETFSVREHELIHFRVDEVVKNHIDTQLACRVFKDEQLLTMLCCKYAYYFRNKMFHGEVVSHSFSFTDKTLENKRVDILNTLLESLTTDLIMCFDSL